MATKFPVLFELLSARGITAKKLSDDTGISTGNISDWKSGKSAPSIEKLSILADYFNVTTDYLLGKSTEDKKDPPTENEIKFALFGTTDIDDELYEDVKRLAKMHQQLRAEKNRKDKSD